MPWPIFQACAHSHPIWNPSLLICCPKSRILRGLLCAMSPPALLDAAGPTAPSLPCGGQSGLGTSQQSAWWDCRLGTRTWHLLTCAVPASGRRDLRLLLGLAGSVQVRGQSRASEPECVAQDSRQSGGVLLCPLLLSS